MPLDSAFQRPCTVSRIVPLFCQPGLCVVINLEGNAVFRHLLVQTAKQDVYDTPHMVQAQRVEHDRFVDAIQKFRVESTLELVHDVLFDLVQRILFTPLKTDRRVFLDRSGADVGSHDENHVLEVHLAPVAVGEVTIVHDLKKHVVDIRVGLLNLVKKHDRVRPAPHLLRELATLIVAHVPGGRSGQPRHTEAFHVLRHVDPDERTLMAEQKFRKSTRQFGLADACGAQKDKRSDRAARVLETGP